MSKAEHASTLKNCDIVMKGGITSGVVYPPAIVELAKEYRFKNIGGASAGAIAAAATAAAEYGRLRKTGTGFDGLARLPEELAKPDFLVRLFSPSDTTAQGYRVAISVMKAQGIGRVFVGLASLLINFLGGTLLGLLFSSALIVPVALFGDFTSLAVWKLLTLGAIAVVTTAVITFITVTSVALLKTAGGLASNGYGFCSGFSRTPGSPHLTNWMHDLVNRLAGLSGNDVLTFGHLWTADGSDGKTNRAINLEVITTNLTHLGPYTIPFRQHLFYFHPGQWRELFPESIVEWLLAHPGSVERSAVAEDGTVLVPLPEGKDLPVVVAARLSLSFPGLVSAVPLYAVDFSLKRNIDPKTKALGERCWFSDGGISSNFPIHFFDSPIPQWPTFAINLKQPHPEHDTPGSDFVYLPSSCRAGQLVSWHRFNPTRHAVADLVAFVGAIISTMESWRDSLQTRMPGYRNRIAHISLKPNEGGLNLTMPPDLVNELTKRGKKAGEKLRTEFNFSQHVWTRYRSTMSILASYLEKLCDDYEHPAREANAVWEIIKGTSKDKPPCYPWDSEEQRVFAVTATAAAAGMGCDWSKSHHFQKGAPNPEPELSARPNF